MPESELYKLLNHFTSYVTFTDTKGYSECCEHQKWSKKEGLGNDSYSMELFPKDITICVTGMKIASNFDIRRYFRVLNMPRIMNMPAFRIYQGS